MTYASRGIGHCRVVLTALVFVNGGQWLHYYYVCALAKVAGVTMPRAAVAMPRWIHFLCFVQGDSGMTRKASRTCSSDGRLVGSVVKHHSIRAISLLSPCGS